MSIESEFQQLLISDVSTAAVDQITSRVSLWLTNTAVHVGFGFVGYHLWQHLPRYRKTLLASLLMYVALQVVQLRSPGSFPLLLADGSFDVAVLWAGWTGAFALSLRGISDV